MVKVQKYTVYLTGAVVVSPSLRFPYQKTMINKVYNSVENINCLLKYNTLCRLIIYFNSHWRLLLKIGKKKINLHYEF